MNPLTEPLPDSVISTNDLIRYWGCSRQSIQRWKKQGLLTPVGQRTQHYYLVVQVDELAKAKGRLPVNRFRETLHLTERSSTPQK